MGAHSFTRVRAAAKKHRVPYGSQGGGPSGKNKRTTLIYTNKRAHRHEAGDIIPGASHSRHLMNRKLASNRGRLAVKCRRSPPRAVLKGLSLAKKDDISLSN